jgi:hypothetical protein
MKFNLDGIIKKKKIAVDDSDCFMVAWKISLSPTSWLIWSWVNLLQLPLAIQNIVEFQSFFLNVIDHGLICRHLQYKISLNFNPRWISILFSKRDWSWVNLSPLAIQNIVEFQSFFLNAIDHGLICRHLQYKISLNFNPFSK